MTIVVSGNENSGSITATGSLGSGGIVGLAYNHATVTGNTNTAASISGGTFAAGIVGGLQYNEQNLTIGTPTAENPRFVVTGNNTETALSSITGNYRTEIAWNNDGTNAVFLKISDNTTN